MSTHCGRARRLSIFGALVAVCSLAVLVSVLVPARAGADDGDPAAQTLSALQNVPGLVAVSATVSATSDGDSALTATDAGSTVDVPTDSSAPVDLSTGGSTDVQIGIPGADSSSQAYAVAPGIVGYSGTDDSTLFAVQAVPAGSDATPTDTTDDETTVGAGVRVLTVLRDANAPTTYTFQLTLPVGATLQAQDDGSYLVLGADGSALAEISAPWAQDASGNPVPATYTLDGTTLTMHVDTSNAVFPITADPEAAACVVKGPSSVTDRRNAVIAAAEAENRYPYVFGGGSQCGPTSGGFDCSGLMMFAYAKIGISLPHYSGAGGQFSYGTAVNPIQSALQPGDLVFYSGASNPQHVGMYIGNGQVEQALGAKWGIGIWPLNFAGTPVGARRLIK